MAEREQAANAELDAAAASRQLTVTFNADVSDGMPWKFRPTQRSVTLRPGESTLAFYVAENLSNKSIIGVSTYNVTPQQAGYYFNKIQCFCFEEQKLRPGEHWLATLGPPARLPSLLPAAPSAHAGEQVDMPVFFYIDPEFAVDPKMKGIDQLTLSYTFFKVDEDEEDLDEAA